MLPAEIGCSGMTCWRRLRDWHAAGVWTRLHRTLLERLEHRTERQIQEVSVWPEV
jgi:transposase